MTPTVNVNLDVSPKQLNMMVDSGAQVSLVDTKVLHPDIKVNTNRKVQITSIHGKEETLGEVGANIVYDSMKIPINLQVMSNCPIPEDGIIGFDVIKPFAVIDGPRETLTWTPQSSHSIEIPLEIRQGDIRQVYPLELENELLNQRLSQNTRKSGELKLTETEIENSNMNNDTWNEKSNELKKQTENVLMVDDVSNLGGQEGNTSKLCNCINEYKSCKLNANCAECLLNNVDLLAKNEIFPKENVEVRAVRGNRNVDKEISLSGKSSENNKDIINYDSEKNFCMLAEKDLNSMKVNFKENKVGRKKVNVMGTSNLRMFRRNKFHKIRKTHLNNFDVEDDDEWSTFETVLGEEEPPDLDDDFPELYSSYNLYNIGAYDGSSLDFKIHEPTDLQVRLEPPDSHKVTLIEEIPARTIKHVLIPLDLKDTVLLKSTECSPGVFAAGGISTVYNGKTIVRIANINSFSVCLRDPKLNFEPFLEEEANHFNVSALSKECDTGETQKIDGELMRFCALSKELQMDSKWTSEEREFVLGICREYQDLFYLEGDLLSHTNAIVHRIPTDPNKAPSHQKNYRLPKLYKDIINEHTYELLSNDIIEPTNSPWNSPLIVVPKKAGPDGRPRYRVVVDFRRLNEQTVGDAYPLPRIDEILDQLKDAKYFTTLDLASGYHQVLVDPQDRAKTAFSTSFGHFEFKRMPFGLKGAPATFQRLMNQVLLGLQGLQCFVYLDDVVTYGSSLSDHAYKLRNVLNRLREANLRLQPAKCFFLQTEIIYLGHLCGVNGCQPDPNKVEIIDRIKPPASIKELQSFLGVINYYRRFIPNFSKVALPLTNLTKKGVKYFWSTNCVEAFEELKALLKNKVVLKYPDFTKPFHIFTDASNYALGAVLCQGEYPVAFASKTLIPAETRYPTIEKELYGIVWAVEHFRCYVYGTKFVVYTDHKPLLGIHKMRNPSSRLLRLFLKLSEYEITIEFKPGRFNQVADALSRLPLESVNVLTRAMKSSRPDMPLDIPRDKPAEKASTSTKNIANRTTETADLSTAGLDVTKDKNLTTIIEVDDAEPVILDDHEITDSSIRNFYKSKTNIQTISCPSRQKKIIQQFHDSSMGGHQGIDKTVERIQRYYNWTNLKRSVEDYIKSCEICQKCKPSRKTNMQMQLVDVAKYPFFRIFLDVVGPLDVTLTGYKYILTIMDDLSRYFNAYPMRNQDSATLCKIFVNNILSHHKTPKVVVTDNGSNFTSKEFTKLCKLFGIKKMHATAYHPQSNGALERAHRSLGQYLRSFCQDSPQHWDELLPYACYVHNNSVNRSTKLAPNDIIFGYISDFPIKIPNKISPQYNFECQFSNVYHSLHKVWAWARKNQEKAKEISKSYYDRNVKEVFFSPGDKVFVRNEARKGKFSFLWNGPYEVVKQSGPVTTLIKVKQKSVKIHNNRLKICYPRISTLKKVIGVS